MKVAALVLLASSLVLLVPAATPVQAQDAGPPFLGDRGTGIPTSMFGIYVRKGEFLVYPFYEYYYDHNAEYKPAELGYVGDEDLRGKSTAHEGLIFLGYGITDWLSVEMEMAVIDARLETDPNDPSDVPAEIHESGTGDVEGQIRARLWRESAKNPEIFTYFEAVSPQQKDKVLIGTPDWELKLGVGVIRGFAWGTMTARFSGEYSLADDKGDPGEYAIEYLRRVSPEWRVYFGLEGTQDEVSLVPEAQWHVKPDEIIVKLNSAFGITSKAGDWTPEVGVLFAFGRNE
jgi:hypothetical protein